MNPRGSITSGGEYHLSELEIALSPADPRRVMPSIPAGCRRVLDLGCGAGQTLAASDLRGALPFGIDYDFEALQLGKAIAPRVTFVQGTGEALPFCDEAFSFVFSRVALPYMRIPAALAELARVLKPGGELWLVLHPLSMLFERKRKRSLRSVVFDLYRLMNSATLHCAGWQFRYPLNRRVTESWQTGRGIRLSLQKAGFETLTVSGKPHFVVTARKT